MTRHSRVSPCKALMWSVRDGQGLCTSIPSRTKISCGRTCNLGFLRIWVPKMPNWNCGPQGQNLDSLCHLVSRICLEFTGNTANCVWSLQESVIKCWNRLICLSYSNYSWKVKGVHFYVAHLEHKDWNAARHHGWDRQRPWLGGRVSYLFLIPVKSMHQHRHTLSELL